jgi:hypothetical protein
MTWDKSDSARFRQYNTQTGGKLISFLRSCIHRAEGDDIEEYALRAAYKQGAEDIVSRLEEIITDVNKEDDASSASFTSM